MNRTFGEISGLNLNSLSISNHNDSLDVKTCTDIHLYVYQALHC